MSDASCPTKNSKGMSFFERYLTVWVALCIVAGIVVGKLVPDLARTLDGMAISVDGAPVVSIPIALCLFFMMYPIMVKIDFAEVLQAGKAYKPVILTLFVNWAIKPFTMYAIAAWFLGSLLLPLIGPDAVDHVKLPLGTNIDVGQTYGAGIVVLQDGVGDDRCFQSLRSRDCHGRYAVRAFLRSGTRHRGWGTHRSSTHAGIGPLLRTNERLVCSE